MLYAQLEAAIGKVVTAEDFRLFMQHHERKLFVPAARPKPFSYAIRRPDHHPDGVLSIEAAASTAAGLAEPILTTVRALPCPNDAAPMSFAINAATSISFTGDRYLHAYVSQTFAGSAPPSLQLCARARQFSSFVMLIGRMGSATTFQPQYGIILQNKDDLTIPLMLETLPSAKEFKDAIESLSPEQRRFAKAYREMQLEGSVFGVLIIQLKPQLEALLKLPADSLTKEIQLCQDLLELFVAHQIPSDLLAYDGNAAASPGAKVNAVKAHVAAIHQMVRNMKEQEIADAKQHHAFENPRLIRSYSERSYHDEKNLERSFEDYDDSECDECNEECEGCEERQAECEERQAPIHIERDSKEKRSAGDRGGSRDGGHKGGSQPSQSRPQEGQVTFG